MNKLALLFSMLLPMTALAAEPELRLVDFSGRPVKFADVQRDATIVAFWMLSCAPCIEEMPLLDALQKKAGKDPQITVLGVNVDPDSELPAVKTLLAKNKVSYRMLRDPQYSLLRKWFPEHPEQTGLPLILVTDRQLHASYSQGFRPGTTAQDFVQEWWPRIIAARDGELHAPLQRVEPKKGLIDPAAMAVMIEKVIRSHHPELPEAEVKKRTAAAIKEFREKGRLSVD